MTHTVLHERVRLFSVISVNINLLTIVVSTLTYSQYIKQYDMFVISVNIRLVIAVTSPLTYSLYIRN